MNAIDNRRFFPNPFRDGIVGDAWDATGAE